MTIPERRYPVTLGSRRSFVILENTKAKTSMDASRKSTSACGGSDKNRDGIAVSPC
jgi:hypothetical protein